MKTHLNLTEVSFFKKTIVTIGTFDGVHLGHKKILKKLVENANQINCESVVLTFFPHPQLVLNPQSNIKLLNTIEEKIDLLDKTGLNHLIIQPFDTNFSKLTAEEFVKSILVDTLNIQKIIIGYDHRFGHNRSADINDLIEFGKKFNFEVGQISVEELDEIAISSTKIRNALQEGNIDLAKNYLGYHYTFSGKVGLGKQLGRTIGFPTANVVVEEEYKLIPKTGVYIVKCEINKEIVFGMMNIGYRPTVNGKNKTIEVHLFHFDQDLYNKTITVSIIHKLREEQKFDSVELLKEQLNVDKVNSFTFLNLNGFTSGV